MLGGLHLIFFPEWRDRVRSSSWIYCHLVVCDRSAAGGPSNLTGTQAVIRVNTRRLGQSDKNRPDPGQTVSCTPVCTLSQTKMHVCFRLCLFILFPVLVIIYSVTSSTGKLKYNAWKSTNSRRESATKCRFRGTALSLTMLLYARTVQSILLNIHLQNREKKENRDLHLQCHEM